MNPEPWVALAEPLYSKAPTLVTRCYNIMPFTAIWLGLGLSLLRMCAEPYTLPTKITRQNGDFQAPAAEPHYTRLT